MIVAICIDENDGISFFGKRLSRDREVIKDFMSLSRGKVFIAPYSRILFSEYDVICDSEFLDKAGKGDYCFVENRNIDEYSEKIEKIVIYNWNRPYPSDKKFKMPDGFVHTDSTDFEGYSHENISREIYSRRK